MNPGDKLGPYEILEPIGKGGMGEVYRARDTRLQREVAVKVSAQQFSERFEREARAIAALNHPNICHLYDVGPNYLVMELIDGPTLTERIKTGAIPLEESLHIASQIAAALEAAHEKGITHRDLKPGNVKVKPDGTVKVLDFGLAKVAPLTSSSGGNSPELSPTLSMAATQAGVVLGTAAYMAPEQARGKPVDKRADIWAFGVVLYEMVTGKRLFAGEDLTETLASVVKEKPDFAPVPTHLRAVIEKCLEKNPAQRLRDIGDWKLLLETSTAPAPAARTAVGWVPWAVAAVFAVLAAGALLAWAPWRAEPLQPLVRLEVDLGADVAIPSFNGPQTYIALSPDGARLAYVASVAGAPIGLYTRRLDQAQATELPGTTGAQSPFFSPDGQWIGFFNGTKAAKISVEGGAVVPLGDVTPGPTGAWGADDSILLAGTLTAGIRRLPSSRGLGGNDPAGTNAQGTVTELENGEAGHVQPQFLPGGKFALFSVIDATANPDAGKIKAVPLAGGPPKVVASGGVSGLYLPSGHLLYVNRSTLFAVPFDVNQLEARGNPVPILNDVRINPITGNVDLAFANNGTLVYRPGAGSGSSQTTMQWIDVAGKRSPLLAKGGTYANPRLSPDGRRVALAITEGGSSDIGIYDPQRDAITKLTFGNGPFNQPVWTPDGLFVIFQRLGVGLLWTRADGAGQPQPLVESKGVLVPSSVSPDGKHLAYFELGAADGWLHTVEITNEGGMLKAGKPVPFFASKFVDVTPEFSPDGRWIAYGTNESGQGEVVVRPFPPPASGEQGGKWQVSTGGGANPHWSRNTRELRYQAGNQIMAVSYTVNGDSFVADKPRVKIDNLGGTVWDLAPDGRIAVLTPAGSAGAAPTAEHTVIFLQNFFDELRRRVPVN